MQDGIYNEIVNRPRPSLLAANCCVLLAAAGLWVAKGAQTLLSCGGGDSLLIMNLLYYIPFMTVPVLVYAARHPGLYDAMRMNPLPFGTTALVVLLALMSVLMSEVIDAAWMFLLTRLGVNYALSVPAAENVDELIHQIFMLAAFPAVCEELLFRGFALSAWETRGTRFAVIVTAVLFTLIHGNILGLPVFMALGLLIGYLVYALDSIYAGIVFHTVYNTACLVIPYLLQGRMGQQLSSQAMPTGIELALSAALEFALVGGMMAMLLFSVRMRSNYMGVGPIPRIRRPLSGKERASLAAAVIVMIATNVIIAAMNMRYVAQMGGAA